MEKLAFNNGAISLSDWEGIEQFIDDHKIKSILEFGSGMSTICFLRKGLRVDSYETDIKWLDKVADQARAEGLKNYRISLWDNKTEPEELNSRLNPVYGLGFVDGKDPRDVQLATAMSHCKHILVHDGMRKQEKKIIDTLLLPDPSWREVRVKGRCRAFVKERTVYIKEAEEPTAAEQSKPKGRSPYAIATSFTPNYAQYLVALLNSLDYHGHDNVDVHVLAVDPNEKILRKIMAVDWCFNLMIMPSYEFVDFSDTRYESLAMTAKKSRYSFLQGIMRKTTYDALLFMDCDMFFTANVTRFFEMVRGTDILLGCNERFKWNMNRFMYKGQELKDVTMHWMVCNAPLFFCPSRNRKLVFWMNEMAKHLSNISDGKRPSDLYTMNVAIGISGKDKDVISLPDYSWTGVHSSYLHWLTRAVLINTHAGHDEMFSLTGEKVYVIHGRWDKSNAGAYELSELEKRYNELRLDENVKTSLRAASQRSITDIKKAWNFYTTQHKLSLADIGV